MHIDGTVTTLTFTVGIISSVVAGQGSNATSGDAVGFAVTFDQDTSSAPASYNQGAAPQHVIGDLALGSGVDLANAPGDAQDALRSWPPLTTAMIGSDYPVTIPISGASRAGRVCGYIDFEHSGTFSADPQHQSCASFAAGARSVTLHWTVPSSTTAGVTYARLRAAYDPAQAQRPTGPASSGEVEDYALSILPTVTITNALPPGTAGQFDLSIDNTVVKADTTDGGTTDAATVGPAAPTPAAPSVAIGTDVTHGPVALTVSESLSRGSGFTYTTAIACVDGLGVALPSGNSTIQSVSIPQSSSAGGGNGKAQNITCAFTNTGIGALRTSSSARPATLTAIGQTVDVDFPVTNTGPVSITGLTLSGQLTRPGGGQALPINCPVTTLATGASTTCTATYSYLVTNTGNAPVAGLRLNDSLPGSTAISCTATMLAPNASTTCAAPPYTATQADVDQGAVNNRATVSGSAGAATVTAPASTLVTPIKAPSGLRVTLAGAVNGAATVGDEVTWHAVVTNTGLTTVHGLTLLSVSGAPAACAQRTLAPSASVTCTLPASTVDEAQTNAGQVTTDAVATGHSVSGSVSSDRAVLALPVGAPIPLTSISDLGPTLGAGGGALIAGLGLLLLAKSRPRPRRRAL